MPKGMCRQHVGATLQLLFKTRSLYSGEMLLVESAMTLLCSILQNANGRSQRFLGQVQFCLQSQLLFIQSFVFVLTNVWDLTNVMFDFFPFLVCFEAPTPRSYHTATLVGDLIYVFSGDGVTNEYDNLFCINTGKQCGR